MTTVARTKNNHACCVCKVAFRADSYIGSLTAKQTDRDTPKLVCRECHNTHYSKGE